MHPSLGLDEATLSTFCKSNCILRLSLFGSRLKGTARPDSDVDLLVEFDPAHVPSLFGIARMEIALSEPGQLYVETNRLPKPKQRFVVQMLDTVLQQQAG